MPEIGQCPHCGAEVSARGVECGLCGTGLNEVPISIGLDLIESLRDADLGQTFFKYVGLQIECAGCYRLDGPRDREILLQMPHGLVAGWTLMVLDSESMNGGFHQWLNNSSGETADLALQSLRLIGAEKHVQVVEQVLALDQRIAADHPCYAKRFDRPRRRPDREEAQRYDEDFERKYEPEFNRLDEAYYELRKLEIGPETAAQDEFWNCCFPQYVRRHPSDCVHPPSEIRPQQ